MTKILYKTFEITNARYNAIRNVTVYEDIKTSKQEHEGEGPLEAIWQEFC